MAHIDDDILDNYRSMASAGQQFIGYTVMKHAEAIAGIVGAYDVASILDYGSGGGVVWRTSNPLSRIVEERFIKVRMYDPAFEGIDEYPTGTYDLVICCDVLEHVAEHHLEGVLDDLRRFATKALFVTTCSRPAKKVFKDGRNMHLTVKPFEWWAKKIVVNDGVALFHIDTP
jgi:hypothetical protein